MLVAVSLLAISLSFLIYRHPPSTWSAFFSSPANPPAGPPPRAVVRDGVAEEPKTATKEESEETQNNIPPTNVEPDVSSKHTPSPETTPKAAPSNSQNGLPVPTFTLGTHDSSDDDEEDNLPPPSFPALNSAQRASKPSLMTPPTKHSQPSLMAPPTRPSQPTLMPPPSKPTPNLMAPPPRILPSNLRALPTNGPIPNRNPAPNRGPPTSSLNPAAALTPAFKVPNARNKVQLTPGHSPLDWATLQRSGTNLSGVSSLQRVTPSMLKYNNGRKGRPAWSSYQGKVYNISPYLPFHPGGEGELRRGAGKDGGKLFMEVHPWVNWENMLGECVVGIMVAEEVVGGAGAGGSLEDMD